MIFVDSNVPMYLIGAPHVNRERIVAFVQGSPEEEYVTSAEVYQEVLHRYVAVDRRDATDRAFALLDDLTTRVFEVTRDDVVAAKDHALAHPGLSARDCLHLAVMFSRGVGRIMTFDRAFAGVPGVTTLP
ncbi:MAG: type II toxin-antitoxin system VapC family toxin [Gammaproteobacteria bacterium]|nr:type II toxin-antitoxin system VapC family toxin [Gammaproteobacteria bacterium]